MEPTNGQKRMLGNKLIFHFRLSEEQKRREIWRKECFQNEQVKKMFQMSDKTASGNQQEVSRRISKSFNVSR